MEPQAQPNILLIVSDDHGYADMAHLGRCDDVVTPHLDRLAAEGVSCEEAYVAAPICSPSRAAIMSGRYPYRWGARWFEDSEFDPTGTPTLAEELASLGYRTGYFGKVHYGHEDVGDRACPPHHGFGVTYYGLAGQQQGRLNYLRHSQEAVEAYGPEASWRMAVQPMLDGDDEVELEGFLTEELGRRVRDFIAGGTSEGGDPERPAAADSPRAPFFAMLAFNAVHNFCWQLPPEELRSRGLPQVSDWNDADGDYLSWYDGSISPNLPHGREYYLAQLELMDREIGRTLDQLDADGLAGDTIVVYLSDNGGSPCNYGDNAPLAGSKYTLWEGGIRVPFLVRWPGGGWVGGVRRQGAVSSLDLLPTLVTAAGGTPGPGRDGVDIAGVLGAGDEPGRDSLHWEHGFQWAVRQGPLKLRWVEPGAAQARAITELEHADPGSGLSLHDVVNDPAERHDLAESRPDDVARLRECHREWRARVS